ncbi:TonB-dependent receptor [Candidatus Poribacteria bacterium]|nr:TonB-dependent receptor [Candidatus Poribacteria bacterium]
MRLVKLSGRQLRGTLYFLVVFSLLLPLSVYSNPEEENEATQSSSRGPFKGEEVLFQEFPVVFGAAKMEQPITQSPSSVTVITAEEIRHSGATNIADLLRRVPGLDVIRISQSDANISARGFDEPGANAFLVLIDGRSVYLDFFGNILWDSLPVVMEEIERIEVIRGPGSALYGANAFSGVVNIITKTPEQLQGTTVSSTVGQFETFINTVIHAGVKDRWSYKAVGSWNETNSMEFDDTNEREDAKASVLLGYQFENDSKLTVSTGFDEGDGSTLAGDTQFAREGILYYGKVNYDYENWKFQTYYNLTDLDVTDDISEEERSIVNNVVDFELQNTLEPNDRNTFIWGLNYRYNRVVSRKVIGRNQTENIYSVFAQDEYRPLDNLTITGGARIDHHPITGYHFSPRLSAVYEPWENHIFRASFSQAFRNPAFVESYLDLQIMTEAAPLPDFPVTLTGNRDLDSEQITSFELGYQTRQMQNRLGLKAEVFYNVMDDFITMLPVAVDPFPPPTSFDFGFINSGKAIVTGGELSLDYSFSDWLSAYLNYSYQFLEAKDAGAENTINEEGEQIKSSPEHKANAGLYAEFRSGISLNMDVHYVSSIDANFFNTAAAIFDPNAILDEEHIDDYVRTDIRVAYKFPKHDVEAAIIISNVFNDVHREWAESSGAESFERQFLFNVTGRF